MLMMMTTRYAPCGADDREADAKTDTQTGPCIRRNGLEEGADIEGLSTTGEEHI